MAKKRNMEDVLVVIGGTLNAEEKSKLLGGVGGGFYTGCRDGSGCGRLYYLKSTAKARSIEASQ